MNKLLYAYVVFKIAIKDIKAALVREAGDVVVTGGGCHRDDVALNAVLQSMSEHLLTEMFTSLMESGVT